MKRATLKPKARYAAGAVVRSTASEEDYSVRAGDRFRVLGAGQAAGVPVVLVRPLDRKGNKVLLPQRLFSKGSRRMPR